MKKLTLAIIYFGMMIQPIHAESITEKAKKVYNKAIALAKKGGSRSQELLKKANFLGNAIKEENAANRALESCKKQRCPKEYEEYKKRDYFTCRRTHCAQELNDFMRSNGRNNQPLRQCMNKHCDARNAWKELSRCQDKNCTLEIKRLGKTGARLDASMLAVGAILYALMSGSLGYWTYRELKAEEEEDIIQEKKRAGRKELEERPVSPIYEENPENPLYEAPAE